MRLLLSALLLHLIAIVSEMGHGQPLTDKERELASMVLRQGANLMLPFVMVLEEYERGHRQAFYTQKERDHFQQATDGALFLIFDYEVRECIGLLREPFDSGGSCHSAWFEPSDQMSLRNQRACELDMLEAFTDCYDRGLLRLSVKE